MFFTVMKVKGRYYLYKVIYVGNKKKKFEYIGPCETIENIMKNLKVEDIKAYRGPSSSWLGRRPERAEPRDMHPNERGLRAVKPRAEGVHIKPYKPL